MNAIVQTACKFVTSSIGRKIIVGITGGCLVLFLLGHLVGNLLIYGGPAAINTYANGLHSMPVWMLWGIRLGLLFIALVHIVYTLVLKLENYNARQQYECKSTITATLSSRTMVWTGVTILVFGIYHLLQFTLQVGINHDEYQYLYTTGAFAGKSVFDCYQMIVHGFSNFWVSGFYIVAIALLWSHLCHGIQSIPQTFGIASRKVRLVYQLGAIGVASVVCLAFISIPTAVLLGFLK